MKVFRKILKLIGFLLLIAFIIGTFAFTTFESRNLICTDIEVIFRKSDEVNVDKDRLIRMAKSADSKIIGKQLSKINSEIIEKAIEKHPAILNADVYKLIVSNEKGKYKGVLVIKVKHREPAMRVVNANGSYYMDENGIRFPVSPAYATRVLVATGSITDSYAAEKILPFVKFVQADDFWRAQIEQIHIESDGNVLLVPLVGGFTIELGDFENYRQKLENLNAFYKQVLADNKWDKYSKISLKYNNQIVAK